MPPDASETRWKLYTAGWCIVTVALLVFDRQMWRGASTGSVNDMHSQPVLQASA